MYDDTLIKMAGYKKVDTREDDTTNVHIYHKGDVQIEIYYWKRKRRISGIAGRKLPDGKIFMSSCYQNDGCDVQITDALMQTRSKYDR